MSRTSSEQAASGDVRRSVMPTTRAPQFRARLAILTVSAAQGSSAMATTTSAGTRASTR